MAPSLTLKLTLLTEKPTCNRRHADTQLALGRRAVEVGTVVNLELGGVEVRGTSLESEHLPDGNGGARRKGHHPPEGTRSSGGGIGMSIGCARDARPGVRSANTEAQLFSESSDGLKAPNPVSHPSTQSGIRACHFDTGG